MGHVVNAKAMRVGWSTIWCDQWYSELQYYSEYLHSIFRIRYYLVYIFTRRHFDKKSIIYSHFEILRHYKNLYVEIYLYSGKLETDYEDYKFNFFYRLYNLERNRDPETREPMFLQMALKLVLIFDWIHFFSSKKLRKKDLLAFIVFLREYEVSVITQYLRKLSFKKYFLWSRPKPPIDFKKRRLVRSIVSKFLGEEIKAESKYDRVKKAFEANLPLLTKNKKLILGYKLDITKNLKKRRKKSWAFRRYLRYLTSIGYFGPRGRRRKHRSKKYFKKHIFTYSKSDVYLFMLLFISFLSAKIYIGKASVWKQPNRNTVLRRFYMAGAAFKEMSAHIGPFSAILGYTFQNLGKFSKVYINFFLTNNNCVNAKFLSRFIGRKLKQNYPLRELLNPIRKELTYIIALTKQGRNSFLLKSKEKYIVNLKNLALRRSYFKTLLSALFVLYRKHINFYFAKNKIWLNLELLLLFIWFNANITDCNQKLVWTVGNYFLNRCGYLCFFDYKMPTKLFSRMFVPKIKLLYAFAQRGRFFGFFNVLYNSIYASKLVFFDLFYFDVTYRMPSVYLRALYINYNRYLRFNYWQYNYRWVVNESGMNHLKSRIAEFTKANNLKGYKMHLKGRFTRKQRAASYWFSKGKVPLNSIDSFVDFAFFTIPLKNSAITVKIWLYKSSDLLHTYFLRIN